MPSENDLAYDALQTMSDKKISAKVMIHNKQYICRVETRGEHLIRLEEEAMAKAEAAAEAEAEAVEAAAAASEENEKREDEDVKPEDQFGASRVQSSGAISAMASSDLANTFSAPPSIKSGVSAATTVTTCPAVQPMKKPSMCDV